MRHNVAVVGCGGVSSMHLDGIGKHPDRVRVVAVCDPDPQRVAATRDQYDIPAGFSSVSEMVNGSEWQVAIICTPTSLREPIVAELAAAGKHILVEKPMASSYQEAERMIALCDKAGVHLAVDQNFRYHYPFELTREKIAAGLIGSVTSIVHRDLFFRQDKGWRTGEKRHGLAVMGIHWLDGMRWILGSDAASLYSQMRSSDAIDCAGDTDATVTIAFENGVIATYVQSFSSTVGGTETLVIGDCGALKVSYEGVALFDKPGLPEPKESWPNVYAGPNKPESAFACLDLLLSSIESQKEPANSGRDNLKTVALLEACYQSASSGSPVRLKKGLLA
ncbi:MAG TPA: Gfo/Idh/MocA family oxidoreductase [Capsulimonadaceae bacterium]|nr:Gfo/Idh/MocA family oxidoreductase [Capsulimonadaceae bacterium]